MPSFDFKPHVHNPTGGMVAGCWYRAVMFNGAVFEFWVSRKLKPKQARQVALEFANGDYGRVYEEGDVESCRKLKGEP